MTYNILEGGRHGGRGEEADLGQPEPLQPVPEDRLEAVVDIVSRARPDVLALQECNGFNADGMRLMYRLERAFEMRGVLLVTQTGFHVALFVRDLELLATHATTYPFHHGALRVELAQRGEPLTVVCTHLCPFSNDARVSEAQYLSTHARAERLVLMGDMNALSSHDAARLDVAAMPPFRRVRHLLPGSKRVDTRAMDLLEDAGLIDVWHRAHPDAHGATLPTPLTGATPRPELRVDYIFATPALASALSACHVLVDDVTSTASDHYPVVADIDW